jgi:hypothetical protein
MSKKIFLIAAAFSVLSVSGFSQTGQSVVSVHPQVGNVIDSTEKRVFNLFPEYRNDVYVAARVLENEDGTMTLRVETSKNKTVEREITQDEISKMNAQINNSQWNYAGDENANNNSQQKKKKNNQQQDNTTTRSPEMDLFWARVIVYGVIIMLDILSSR